MSTQTSYRGILKVAWPMIISGLSIHFIGLIDTVFLAKLGEVPLGAGGNATLLYYMIVSALTGLTLGSQIIFGRRNGEGAFDQIGSVFRHALLVISILSVVGFAILECFTEPLVSSIYASADVAAATSEYMEIRAFGVLPALINFLFIAFFVGITQTRAMAIGAPLIAVINIVLDYGLIFGNLGFEPLGLKGAAYASVIAEASGTVFFAIYVLSQKRFTLYSVWKYGAFEKAIFERIWKIGSPLMIQNLIAVGAWFIFFTLIEQLSERALAISHIARAIYLIMVIPLTSLAEAGNSLVSNLIGEKSNQRISGLLRKLVVLALSVTTIYLTLVNIFPSAILSIFSENPALINEAIPTLRVVSLAIVFFALAFIYYRALAGTGLTALCMRIEIFTVTIYLLLSFALVLIIAPPVEVVWCMEFVYFSLLGTISYYFMKKGKYNTEDF